MKVSAAVSFALAGSAMAAGAADQVNQVLTDISGAIKGFDTAIKAYTGGESKSLIDAAGKIQTLTEGGASKIAAGEELTLNDAVSITNTVNTLQTALDGMLTDLEGIGSKLASSGQCGTITSSLNAQGSAAGKLQEAITSKTPEAARSIAKQLGGKIGVSISNTQAKFKEICANAPSSPSGSTGSSSGSSSGSAPSAAHSGHGSATTPKPAVASSTAPKPATFTGAASRVNACGALALGAAALLAL